MRTFFVTVLSLCSAVAFGQTSDDYRNHSLINLTRESPAHLFLQEAQKYSSIDELPGIYWRYLLKAGQSYSQDGITVHGREADPTNEYDQDMREELAMGYYPTLGGANFPKSGEIWQGGTRPMKFDETQPFCRVGILSTIGPKAPLSLFTHPNDPFPRVTVEQVRSNHSKKAYGVSIALHNEEKNIFFDADCFIPPSHNDFTVGEFEDIFGGRILLKGAQFFTDSEPGSNPISLEGLKVEVLKDIRPTEGPLAATLIQGGRILDEHERPADSNPYCVIGKYDINNITSTVWKSKKPGTVDQAFSATLEMVPESPTYIDIRIKRRNGSPILQILMPKASDFSLWCTMNDGERVPTIDDLNSVAEPYIHFSK